MDSMPRNGEYDPLFYYGRLWLLEKLSFTEDIDEYAGRYSNTTFSTLPRSGHALHW